MLPPRVNEQIRRLVEDLVHERYEALEADVRSGRLTANELREATSRYGRHLTLPPEDTFLTLDTCKVEGQPVPTWSVELPMWTLEDGKSDWTLDLIVIERSPGLSSVEIDDLHVH